MVFEFYFYILNSKQRDKTININTLGYIKDHVSNMTLGYKK